MAAALATTVGLSEEQAAGSVCDLPPPAAAHGNVKSAKFPVIINVANMAQLRL